MFNSLNPKSDKHLNSPNNITPESHAKVMRKKGNVHLGRNLLIGKQILPVSTLGNV